MKHTKKRPFNMVEIVIALVIILVALVSVLGLLPRSIQTTNDAVSRVAAADTAEQLLSYLAARVAGDWENELLAFPDSKSECASDDGAMFSDNGSSDGSPLIPSTALLVEFNCNAETDAYNPVNVNGLYRVTQKTNDNRKEFSAVVKVWKELDTHSTEGAVPIEEATSARLFAEVSWPSNKPYVDREKRNYSIKVFKPGMNYALAPTPPDSCRRTGRLGGVVSLNPTNNTDFTFEMITTAGDHITRATLMNTGTGSEYTFNGTISYMKFCPKSNGNSSSGEQTGLTLDGEPYSIGNHNVYEISGDRISISLYNTNDGTGNALGRWLVDLNDSGATIAYDCDGSGGSGEEEEENTLFEIDGGQVNLLQAATTTFQVLGCSLEQSGTDCYITTAMTINGSTITPFGALSDPVNGNVNDGTAHTSPAQSLAAGSSFWVSANSYAPDQSLLMSVNSFPASQQVLVLENGDMVPDLAAFRNNGSVEAYLRPYVDTSTLTVALGDNEAIMLFELGTTDMTSSAADFQDMVILITMTP